jgi:hypothetical protein
MLPQPNGTKYVWYLFAKIRFFLPIYVRRPFGSADFGGRKECGHTQSGFDERPQGGQEVHANVLASNQVPD